MHRERTLNLEPVGASVRNAPKTIGNFSQNTLLSLIEFAGQFPGRSYASSTMTRRSTTKKIRRGAVIRPPSGIRNACAAKAKMAMSMQAVLPAAVGKAIACGQGEHPSPLSLGASEPNTRAANRSCQAKGGLSLPHNAVKKSLNFGALMPNPYAVCQRREPQVSLVFSVCPSHRHPIVVAQWNKT